MTKVHLSDCKAFLTVRDMRFMAVPVADVRANCDGCYFHQDNSDINSECPEMEVIDEYSPTIIHHQLSCVDFKSYTCVIWLRIE